MPGNSPAAIRSNSDASHGAGYSRCRTIPALMQPVPGHAAPVRCCVGPRARNGAGRRSGIRIHRESATSLSHENAGTKRLRLNRPNHSDACPAQPFAPFVPPLPVTSFKEKTSILLAKKAPPACIGNNSSHGKALQLKWRIALFPEARRRPDLAANAGLLMEVDVDPIARCPPSARRAASSPVRSWSRN
jgi:hypothetical protein